MMQDADFPLQLTGEIEGDATIGTLSHIHIIPGYPLPTESILHGWAQESVFRTLVNEQMGGPATLGVSCGAEDCTSAGPFLVYASIVYNGALDGEGNPDWLLTSTLASCCKEHESELWLTDHMHPRHASMILGEFVTGRMKLPTGYALMTVEMDWPAVRGQLEMIFQQAMEAAKAHFNEAMGLQPPKGSLN